MKKQCVLVETNTHNQLPSYKQEERRRLLEQYRNRKDKELIKNVSEKEKRMSKALPDEKIVTKPPVMAKAKLESRLNKPSTTEENLSAQSKKTLVQDPRPWRHNMKKPTTKPDVVSKTIDNHKPAVFHHVEKGKLLEIRPIKQTNSSCPPPVRTKPATARRNITPEPAIKEEKNTEKKDIPMTLEELSDKNYRPAPKSTIITQLGMPERIKPTSDLPLTPPASSPSLISTAQHQLPTPAQSIPKKLTQPSAIQSMSHISKTFTQREPPFDIPSFACTPIHRRLSQKPLRVPIVVNDADATGLITPEASLIGKSMIRTPYSSTPIKISELGGYEEKSMDKSVESACAGRGRGHGASLAQTPQSLIEISKAEEMSTSTLVPSTTQSEDDPPELTHSDSSFNTSFETEGDSILSLPGALPADTFIEDDLQDECCDLSSVQWRDAADFDFDIPMEKLPDDTFFEGSRRISHRLRMTELSFKGKSIPLPDDTFDDATYTKISRRMTSFVEAKLPDDTFATLIEDSVKIRDTRGSDSEIDTIYARRRSSIVDRLPEDTFISSEDEEVPRLSSVAAERVALAEKEDQRRRQSAAVREVANLLRDTNLSRRVRFVDSEQATGQNQHGIGSHVRYAATRPARRGLSSAGSIDKNEEVMTFSPVRRSSRIAQKIQHLPSSLRPQAAEVDNLAEVVDGEFGFVPNQALNVRMAAKPALRTPIHKKRASIF
ncbi:uncharacterized protein VTP21DRAFT_1473 [Calcarisporiella thermophila]|uniref:uncharacterized protein n=1 Tax=Calcarisporiella thermophila TaxID=911321 RepID=UPI0037430292